MERTKRNSIICVGLLILSILYTIMVQLVDVAPIGPNQSCVGFATFNRFIFELTGVHMIWYQITDWLGIACLSMAVIYGLIGLYQLITRKSFCKVDKEILGLGVFYIVLIGVYGGFEMFVVNYRPILMDGVLDASYPSSHTLMALCLCGSSIMVNRKLYWKSKVTKGINVGLMILMVIVIVGRVLSGVHWFTDILGGVLISTTLLMGYYTFLHFDISKKS